MNRRKLTLIPPVIIICLCLGFAFGTIFGFGKKQEIVVKGVEEIIIESIKTGQPFLFDNGRIGLVLKEFKAPNGKTVAYRAISFMYPEGDPIVFTPINKFKKYNEETARPGQCAKLKSTIQ